MKQESLFSDLIHAAEKFELPSLTHDEIARKVGEGSLFYLNRSYIFSLSDYVHVEALTDTERTLLTDIYQACISESDGLTTLQRLHAHLLRHGRKKGNSIIFRHLRQLVAKGLLSTLEFRPPHKRSVTIYKLRHPKKCVVKPSASPCIDHRPCRKELTRNILRYKQDYQMLTQTNPNKLRSEGLMSGVLDRCLRINHYDKSRILRSEFKIKGEIVRVVTTCLSHTDIALISDQRIVWAVYSIIEQTISGLKSSDVRNQFLIDIKEICHMMGLSATGGNREYIRKGMDRLYGTNFEITCENAEGWFSQRFGLGMTTHNFSFFHTLSSRMDDCTKQLPTGEKVTVRKPRFFLVSLHPKVFETLLGPRSKRFQVNPAVMKTTNGVGLAVYNLSKIVIGVSDKKKKAPFRMKLRHFHQYLLPSCTSYLYFRNETLRLIETYEQRNHPTDSRCALFLGYYLLLSEENGEGSHDPERSRRSLRRGPIPS